MRSIHDFDRPHPRYWPTLQRYDEASPAGPLTYFGNSGYEHIGRLRSPAVTVTDLPGALPRSTQSVSSPTRS